MTNKRRLPLALGTLRVQVVLIMLVCYLLPAAILGFFSQHVLLRSLQEKTETALISNTEHAVTMTVQNIEHAVELARDAIYDGELADTYSRWSQGNISDAEFLRLSRSYLDRKYSRDSLFLTAVYFPMQKDTPPITARTGNTLQTDMETLRAAMLQMSGKLDTRSRFIDYAGQLFLVRNLMNVRMECYGMLVLGIDSSELFARITDLKENWDAELQLQLDQFGDTEMDWNLLPGFRDLPQEEIIQYAVLSDEDDYTLNLLLTMDRRQQYKELYDLQRLSIFIYLLLVPILALIALYVHRRIVRPIRMLSDASKRIEAGELGVTVALSSGDELGSLAVSFSNMSLRMKELIDKTYKEEIELKNAQIQALQSRINPHFINNALETINWQARIERSQTISSMIGALSVLLNATMDRKNRRMVTLREEMEVAEAYIYFVQLRFGEDLTVVRNLDEHSMDSIVPLLSVQPVLENAVEHGIAPAGGGRIEISCLRAGDCVRIRIANTGKGIDEEDREKIDEALQIDDRHAQMTGSHLGLANIANRLHLLYSGRASIEVLTEMDGQTAVHMDIPQDVWTGPALGNG